MTTPSILSYSDLKNAVAGSSAAFRLTLKLEAVSPKVFPPTYEGGKYATEERIINGQRLPCVLLDSVPSQANRMELALQDAVDGGLIELPLVSVDFAAVNHPGVQKITSLQAPHRIADAILRDSTLGEGKKSPKFRESDIGKELDQLSAGYATPLLSPQKDGSLIAEFDLDGTEEIKRWVLSFGRHAEVLEPEELRNEIGGEIETLRGTYGPSIVTGRGTSSRGEAMRPAP